MYIYARTYNCSQKYSNACGNFSRVSNKINIFTFHICLIPNESKNIQYNRNDEIFNARITSLDYIYYNYKMETITNSLLSTLYVCVATNIPWCHLHVCVFRSFSNFTNTISHITCDVYILHKKVLSYRVLEYFREPLCAIYHGRTCTQRETHVYTYWTSLGSRATHVARTIF